MKDIKSDQEAESSPGDSDDEREQKTDKRTVSAQSATPPACAQSGGRRRARRSAAAEKRDVEHTRHVVQLRCTPSTLPLGIRPDEDLTVCKIQPNSPVNGRLHVGDRIVRVGGTPVHSVKQLSRALKVLVVKTEPESLASATLLECDRIVDVDGHPVSHRDVAKRMIIDALNANHTVSMLLERPVAPEAMHEVKALIEGANQADTGVANNNVDWPEYRAPADVCRIIAFERNRLRSTSGAAPGCVPGKSILRRSKGPSDDKRVAATPDENLDPATAMSPSTTPRLRGLRKGFRRISSGNRSTPVTPQPPPPKIKIRRKPVDVHIGQDTDPKKSLKKVVRKFAPGPSTPHNAPAAAADIAAPPPDSAT